MICNAVYETTGVQFSIADTSGKASNEIVLHLIHPGYILQGAHSWGVCTMFLTFHAGPFTAATAHQQRTPDVECERRRP